MDPEAPAACAGAPSGNADADALLAAFVGAHKAYWADRWVLADAQRVVRAVEPEGVADSGALVRIGKGGGMPLCTPPYPGSSQMSVAIGVASESGWNATATHPALPGTRCAIFGGAGPAVAPATIAGKVKCTQ